MGENGQKNGEARPFTSFKICPYVEAQVAGFPNYQRKTFMSLVMYYCTTQLSNKLTTAKNLPRALNHAALAKLSFLVLQSGCDSGKTGNPSLRVHQFGEQFGLCDM